MKTSYTKTKRAAEESLRAREKEGRIRPAFASDEKRLAALELFDLGLGYVRASRILNLSANTLRDWHAKWKTGEFKVQLSVNQYRYGEDVKSRVRAMRRRGATWREIEEATGVSITACRTWVLQNQNTKSIRAKGLSDDDP